jgi:hypothetical protein
VCRRSVPELPDRPSPQTQANWPPVGWPPARRSQWVRRRRPATRTPEGIHRLAVTAMPEGRPERPQSRSREHHLGRPLATGRLRRVERACPAVIQAFRFLELPVRNPAAPRRPQSVMGSLSHRRSKEAGVRMPRLEKRSPETLPPAMPTAIPLGRAPTESQNRHRPCARLQVPATH